MAEYIDRQAALEECDWYAKEFCECEYAIMPLKGALENLNAANVRPVVTCGECKHWFENGTDYCSCDRDALLRERDFFCAAGEKREES